MAAAEALAADRSADRAALRARLDAVVGRLRHDADDARDRLQQLLASRQILLDGAAWAVRMDTELPEHTEAIRLARQALEARQADQRAARTGLDKVLEQRAAAGAAMEDADHQLSELVGAGMDESSLRRELEAAGHAVRAAQEAHAAAVAQAQELLAERQQVERRRAQVEEDLSSASASCAHPVEVVDRVRDALDRWRSAARRGEPDPDAQALVEAFTDLRADLAELQHQAGPRPDAATLAFAEAEAERAAEQLERVGARAEAGALDPSQRAELDAAHDAVLVAEERVGRRIGAAAARQRLEEARRAEQDVLHRFGFASYLDVVLSGGRVVTESPERLAAERAYLAATAARDALRRSLEASPELHYLESEDKRLHAHAAEILGVEPGEAVIGLLRGHPFVDRPVVEALRDALAEVGVRPVGMSLPEAAETWLAQEASVVADEQRARSIAEELRAERDALAARGAALEEELTAAGYGEADAAERLEMAGRSVGTFEAELSLRAGEDEKRLKRFAAADQLRSQVQALAVTLARAEDDALVLLERVTEAAASAEVELDRLQAVLTDARHQAGELSARLPNDRRPEGDPLSTLATLAEELTAQAEVLGPEVATASEVAAEVAGRVDEAAAAAEAAGTGAEGPRAEDLHDSLSALIDGREGVTVMAEPFAGLDPVVRGGLLRVLLECRERGPVVLLTDDADILGWAIGLPADEAAVVPVDALLNLEALGADISTGARTTVTLRPSTDEATTDHDTSARRSAGRH